jgi:hypothetical protein
LIALHPPIVYPAVADRLGLIPRAADIVRFYAIIERLNFHTRAMTNEPMKTVSASNYRDLISLFKVACEDAENCYLTCPTTKTTPT